MKHTSPTHIASRAPSVPDEWADDPALQEALKLEPPPDSRSLAQSVLLMGVENLSQKWVDWGLKGGADPNYVYEEKNARAFEIVIDAGGGVIANELLCSLIGAGSNPNLPLVRNLAGRTLMMDICSQGSSENILTVMHHSKFPIDVMTPSQKGLTPAMEAASNRNVTHEALQALQDHYEVNIWKHGQAAEGEPGFGLPRNHLWTTTDGMGNNALFRTSLTGDALRWLLEHPILGMRDHLEHRNSRGETVLMRMVKYSNIPHMQLLLSHGAVVHDPNAPAASALTKAQLLARTSMNLLPIVDLLTAHQAAEAARVAMVGVLEAQSRGRQISFDHLPLTRSTP